MRRRFGWSLDEEYGWFVTAASGLFATALVMLWTVGLVAHQPVTGPHVITRTIASIVFVKQPPKIVYVRVHEMPTVLVRYETIRQPAPSLHERAVSASTPASARLYWVSSRYRPGDAQLTDIVAVGDVMMGTIGVGLNPALQPHTDVATLVGSDLASIFRHADVAFANLEGPLYDGSEHTEKSCGQCFAFHSPPYYASILASLGIGVVSLANNHSGDYGETGRESTMAALRANGIAFGGLDREGARAADLVLRNGKKVAVIAFAPNGGTLSLNDVPAAERLVRSLKKTHDIVMVSFHGGGEGWSYVHVSKADEVFAGEDRGNVTAFAHAVIDSGADIVVGQGPHVPRAMELYRGHLIAYSLGNFWTYTGIASYAVSGLGPVLEAWVGPDGKIAGFSIHSTRQAGLGVPHLDPLDEAARYMAYLTRSDFPGSDELFAHSEAVVTATSGEGGETRRQPGSGS